MKNVMIAFIVLFVYATFATFMHLPIWTSAIVGMILGYFL